MTAALDVVDRVGVGALTIRAVARRVGAPPMSLYTHFANKEELVDLMHAELSRRLYTDSGCERWEDELLALGQRVRATLAEHPRWVPLLARSAAPAVMPVRERLLALMIKDGRDPQASLESLISVGMVAVGLALVELTFREPEGGSAFSKRFEWQKAWLAQQPADGPNEASREAYTKTPHLDLNVTFDIAMSRLVAGIAGRSS